MSIDVEVIPRHSASQHFTSALESLEHVRARSSNGEYSGIYASSDILFENAIFGRDSIEVAEDLMAIKPEIAKDVISSLVQLQGTKTDPNTEEEPGKIHHEYRTLYINGEKVSEESQEIMRKLAGKGWGTKEEIHYFGSADATPLFVTLVLSYVARNGLNNLDLEFLDTEVMHKSGKVVKVRESVTAALSWIESKIEESPLHLIEFKRSNPQGIEYQAWKDSSTGYIHDFGALANHNGPIATIEVQGYAYDALIEASKILGTVEDKKRWVKSAKHLEDALDQFWIPGEQFFAMGIDRDEQGEPRLIQTLSTNPALLLNTKIFDNLPEAKKKMYISGIVNKITGSEFMTKVGIRTRALKYINIIPHPTDPSKHLSDYHGSETSWIKETYDIAKGLRRQGFFQLAEQLEIRIVNSVIKSGKYYEFYYVDEKGHVNYHPKDKLPFANGRKTLFGTNIPEGNQAWTIAALLASLYNLDKVNGEEVDTDTWQYRKEENILKTVPRENLLTGPVELGDEESIFDIALISN